MTPCFALKNMIGYDIDQKTPCYALKNMIGCDIDQKISGAMQQILFDQAVSMSTVGPSWLPTKMQVTK